MKLKKIISETDRPIILKHVREQYEATCELCGDDSEEADAVRGHIEEYYQSEPELIEMIRKYGSYYD